MTREFEEGKNYIVSVSTKFQGEFVGYEEENGVKYATFHQTGRTDRGKIPQRRIPVYNIVESSLIKGV